MITVCVSHVKGLRPSAPSFLFQIRSALNKRKAGRYSGRVEAQKKRKEYTEAHPLPKSELSDVFK